MIRKTKKARKYSAPSSKETGMALESNFCATVLFDLQVQELDNINTHTRTLNGVEDTVEPMYFEF